MLTTAAVFGFQPFSFSDFQPPPRRPIYNQQVEAAQNHLPIGIPKAPPFFQNDQPNPSKRPVSYQDQNLETPLTLGVGKFIPPFQQNDQPNPSKRPVSYQDQNEGVPLFGFPKPAAPFFLNDQPNPSKRPVSYPDQNRGVPLFGFPIPAAPFLQSNFDANPVPPTKRYQPDLIPNLLTNILIPVPNNLPFGLYDWPAPPRIKNANNEGTWVFGSGLYSTGLNWTPINDNQGGIWTPIGTTIPPVNVPLTADSTLYTADNAVLTADLVTVPTTSPSYIITVLTADGTLYTADSTTLTADQVIISSMAPPPPTMSPWTPVVDGNTPGWAQVGVNRSSSNIGGVS